MNDYAESLKFEAVEELYEKARNAKKQYLRKNDWDLSCDFPDSTWRWVKTLKGVTLALPFDDAFSMQSHIEAWGEN